MSGSVVRSAIAPALRVFLDPVGMVRNLWAHREITWQLARRDLHARYRGSRLGLAWAVVTPLAMLSIYTFAFAVVLHVRWGDRPDETTIDYALTLFCGLLIYNVFAEVVARAPALVVSAPNYVKKVVFPLEVFVPAAVITALTNALIGGGVWLLAFVALEWSRPRATALLLPVVLVPVALLAAGTAWILASVGVFVRDVGHAVGLTLQMLFFLTPIFYRLDSVPMPYRGVIALNPLAYAVEDMRRVMMWGEPPQLVPWLVSVIGGSLIALAGYAFFMKSKRAFADVL